MDIGAAELIIGVIGGGILTQIIFPLGTKLLEWWEKTKVVNREDKLLHIEIQQNREDDLLKEIDNLKKELEEAKEELETAKNMLLELKTELQLASKETALLIAAVKSIVEDDSILIDLIDNMKREKENL